MWIGQRKRKRPQTECKCDNSSIQTLCLVAYHSRYVHMCNGLNYGCITHIHFSLPVDKRSITSCITWNFIESMGILWLLSHIPCADNFTVIYATDYSQLTLYSKLHWHNRPEPNCYMCMVASYLHIMANLIMHKTMKWIFDLHATFSLYMHAYIDT